MAKGEIPVGLVLECQIYETQGTAGVDAKATIINEKSDKVLPASNKVVKFYRDGVEVGSVETDGGVATFTRIHPDNAGRWYAVLYFADREIRSNEVVLEI